MLVMVLPTIYTFDRRVAVCGFSLLCFEASGVITRVEPRYRRNQNMSTLTSPVCAIATIMIVKTPTRRYSKY